MIEKIKNYLRMIRKFVARSDKNNYLRLRFGHIVSVLDKKRYGFSSKYSPSIGWNKGKGMLYIAPKFEPNPHIVISGMSGFGKSTLFKSLLLDIRKAGIPCIVFDAHNEHADIVRGLNGSVHNAAYSGINILDLDGASISERTAELTRLFKEVYSLGYIQATKLRECLWYTYRKAGARDRLERHLKITPSVRDLVDELNIFIRNSATVGERNTLLHLKDRISLLNNTAFSGNTINVKGLNNGINSFSLANMKSKEAQLIYIGELLNRLYTTMHDSGQQNGLRLYIMIDEAQFLVDDSNNNSVIAKLIEEGRKYGVGVIIVTHAASSLNRKIMANSSTFATFYAREPTEVNYVAKVLSGGSNDTFDSVRNRIGQLKQNQIMLVSYCRRNPVVVSTPRFDDIESHNHEVNESEIVGFVKTRARRPVKCDELLDSGIRIDNIMLDRIVASRVLDRLVIDNGHAKETWLMLHNRSLSIEHEVWVRRISEMLSANSLENRVIDSSDGPDIVARIKGKNIAIEYETGLKTFESTSKMIDSRIARYDNVIVFTNDLSFTRYKENLDIKGVAVVSACNAEQFIRSIATSFPYSSCRAL